MKVLVIDGQGGGIGKLLVAGIKSEYPDFFVTAVGANSIATSAMLKAGDVIAGPVGIVVADSLLGEITPEMAQAIGQSDAKRVLIPVNHCDNIVVGVGDIPVARLVQAAVKEIGKLS